MIHIMENAFINVKNASVDITAEIEVAANAHGVIQAQGGRFGGWALWLNQGRPTYSYNWIGVEQYTVTAEQPITPGKHTLTMSFAYDGAGKRGAVAKQRCSSTANRSPRGASPRRTQTRSRPTTPPTPAQTPARTRRSGIWRRGRERVQREDPQREDRGQVTPVASRGIDGFLVLAWDRRRCSLPHRSLDHFFADSPPGWTTLNRSDRSVGLPC